MKYQVSFLKITFMTLMIISGIVSAITHQEGTQCRQYGPRAGIPKAGVWHNVGGTMSCVATGDRCFIKTPPSLVVRQGTYQVDLSTGSVTCNPVQPA